MTPARAHLSRGIRARQSRRSHSQWRIFWLAAAGLAAGVVAPPAAAGPLNFTLERVEDRSGDFPLVYYTFRAGGKRYTFCPPATWSVSADAAGMSFSSTTPDGEANARFRASTPAELALLRPDQQARREPSLRQNLPAGITDLHLIGAEITNPAPTLGTKGCEFTYRFAFYGRELDASVMICQLNDGEGITLTATAPAKSQDNFIALVHRTLGAIGVSEDRPGSH